MIECQRVLFGAALVEARGIGCHYLEQHTHGVDAEEGVARLTQLQNSHAQRPDVHLLVIGSAFNDLCVCVRAEVGLSAII